MPRAVTVGKTVPANRRERTMAAEVAGKSPESVQTDRLAARLAREITGDVLFDPFSRGRYATDASFYQIVPSGVVVPKTMDEALRALAIARDEGLKVTPRGGGTSQCGQTVNDGLVVDLSKHLNRILSLDVEGRTCVVEPGIVLDDLNRQLKSTACGFRSTSPRRRAPPSAAWPATIPAAAAPFATAPCATTRCRWRRRWPTAR